MKIKIKIIAVLLIMALCLPNFVFAAMNYSRDTTSPNLKTVATVVGESTVIDGKYNAKTNAVKADKIEIYRSNGEQYTSSGNTDEEASSRIEYSENADKYYLSVDQSGSGDNITQYIHAAFIIGEGDKSYSDFASILYKDGINYNGKSYNVRMNVTNLRKTGENKVEFLVARLGNRKKPTTDPDTTKYDVSTYTNASNSCFSVGKELDSNNNVVTGATNYKCSIEADITYTIEDNDGNAVDISGILRVDDIDSNQGIFMHDYVVSASNTYMASSTEQLKLKQEDDGSYIFASTSNDTSGDDVFFIIDNKPEIKATLTWDHHPAWTPFRFDNTSIKMYKSVITEVINGTIDPSVTNIEDGQDKTISYTPNEGYFLKSIKVDGSELSPEQLVTNKDSYTFSNINEDHTIVVEYEAMLKVIHNPNGGTPEYDVQYVMPEEKATPVQEPTREGYEFGGWYKEGEEDTPFDYETPITEDTTLVAKWTPIENNYNITYVLNGGENDPSNPGTYKAGDEIDFENPTRDGYEFLGWYEDPDFTTPKNGITPDDTGDKTVYAKWQEEEPAPGPDVPVTAAYKVEHYKQQEDGSYERASTDSFTDEVGKDVTATPKTYDGYEENTTYSGRIPTGTVKEDGSLVLKLYYDKIAWKVTYDSKGGNPTPDTETVKNGEKATKPSNNPTKDGYDFIYWYYVNDNGENVAYDFDTPVTKDVHLIARWEKKPEPTPTPDITPTPGKQDPTTSPTILPYTGIIKSVVAIFIVAVAAILGFRYFKFRDI